MSQVILKDYMHRIIGYIDTDASGKKTVRDEMRRIKGYYDPKTNITMDEMHRIVGYGDLLASLIR